MYDDLVPPSFATECLMATSLFFSEVTIDIQFFHIFIKAIKGMRICVGLSSVYYASNSCA